jgi:hypothetical protein
MYNRVEFGESFANADDARTDADGFAAKLTVGPGNVFFRCIAHHNIDDGWDLFSKKESGPIGVTLIIECFAYNNGRYMNQEIATRLGHAGALPLESSRAGGGGFKIGGEGIPIPHHVIDSIAFGNDGDGFTSNSNPAILLTHCTSVDNGNRWRQSGRETSKQMNYTIYAAGTASIEGLDAVVNQLFSWWSPRCTDGCSRICIHPGRLYLPFDEDGLIMFAPNDRVEAKSPASGFIFRRAMSVIGDETVDGRSVQTLFIIGKQDDGTNNYEDGRIIQGNNIVSSTPNFHPGNVAPFYFENEPRIEGAFFAVIGDTADGPKHMNGLPDIGDFMKLDMGNSGIVPGARGLWR